MANITVFWFLLRNEVRGFVRNRMAVFWAFIFPIFIFTVFSVGVGGADNLGGARIEIVDHDKTKTSKEYSVFITKAMVSGDGVRMAVVDGDGETSVGIRQVRLTIPEGFAHAFEGGPPAAVEVVYNFSGSPAVRAAAQLIRVSTTQYSALMQDVPLTLTTHQSNTGHSFSALSYSQYLLAGVMVMAMLSTGIMSTSIVLVALRELGVFGGYGALPINRINFILAIVCIRLLVVVLAAVGLTVGAKLIYSIPLDIWNLSSLNAIGLILLGAITFCSFGIALGARISDMGTITVICNMIYFPLIIFGNLTFRMNSLPDEVQQIVSFVPVHEFAEILRAVLFQTASFHDQLPVLVMLVGWCSFFLLLAWRTFKWNP